MTQSTASKVPTRIVALILAGCALVGLLFYWNLSSASKLVSQVLEPSGVVPKWSELHREFVYVEPIWKGELTATQQWKLVKARGLKESTAGTYSTVDKDFLIRVSDFASGLSDSPEPADGPADVVNIYVYKSGEVNP